MKRATTAIVIGGSISGLLCARVLADQFDEVRVLERDLPGERSAPRKGAPQGRHAHVWMASGLRALEELFPGLHDELVADGAVPTDLGRDVRWYVGGGYHARSEGIESLQMSRPGLETRLRDRVEQLDNVLILSATAVESLAFDAGEERVTGVFVQGFDEAMSADLVVDATGRGSRTPRWLESLGMPAPQEETVRTDLGYTTQVFQRSPLGIDGDLAVAVVPDAPGRRGGFVVAAEDNRWFVTLAGMHGDHPPTDAEGFLDFAASLPVRDIHDAIVDAKPLSEPVAFRFPANRRWRYDRLRRFPSGYLVFGDAVCSLNPIYGQGMSVVALQAIALRDCIARGGRKLAPRFFKAALQVLKTPWMMAVNNDARYPEARGRRTLRERIVAAYLRRLHVAARRVPAVAHAFLRTANLLTSPYHLLRPRVLRALFARGGSNAIPHRSLPPGPTPQFQRVLIPAHATVSQRRK
ncbi:MAG: FAD-dependent monooxygenase [Myxococcota bacterium]